MRLPGGYEPLGRGPSRYPYPYGPPSWETPDPARHPVSMSPGGRCPALKVTEGVMWLRRPHERLSAEAKAALKKWKLDVAAAVERGQPAPPKLIRPSRRATSRREGRRCAALQTDRHNHTFVEGETDHGNGICRAARTARRSAPFDGLVPCVASAYPSTQLGPGTLGVLLLLLR